MMSLYEDIKNYMPVNEQEAKDKEQMLQFIRQNDNYLLRENQVAHFTASVWTVNKEHTKTLMVYHNIYDSWSWIGGHADGVEDLCSVAMRELQEETGVRNAVLAGRDIFSLETLTVDGHVKKGVYVPGHLHFNVTYLAKADEEETLIVNEAENQAVKWFAFEDALKASTEPWMVEHIYKKLIEKLKENSSLQNEIIGLK
jgi:ADP-ribose pyrophosphatase YjhB (NUDIX family)